MPKILIIEDEVNIRELLIELLTLTKFQVASASDGRSGVQLAHDFQPDLILCDIAMPELNGFDVLHMLHQEVDTASTPFIFLTARVEQTDRRQARLLGADDYLLKPFTPDELLEAINARLERHSIIAKASVEKALDKSTEQMVQEAELYRAIINSELLLHYQPQVSLRTNQVVGAEALVRWQHPKRGMIPPSEFIPLAEQSGLIKPLGEWVLRIACQQMKTWHRAGFEELRIGVNVSSVQLNQIDFCRKVRDVLKETELDGASLELELTETAVIQNMGTTTVVLQELKEQGVRTSIDDFGMGYASLGCLQYLPIDTLKIDRCFVRSVNKDRKNKAIVSAIIQMAHGLNLDVIAEGVETEDEANSLRLHGCDEAQGYFYSRPLVVSTFNQLLAHEYRIRNEKSLVSR